MRAHTYTEREASDGLLYFLAIGPYTNRKYKTKLCTQTNKQDIQTAKHTDKQDRYQQTKTIYKRKADQNSHTRIMRHYDGR